MKTTREIVDEYLKTSLRGIQSRIKNLENLVRLLADEIDKLKASKNVKNPSRISTVPPKGTSAWEKKY